jgi:hypothetical protein
MNLKKLLLICVVGIASSSHVCGETIDQIGSLTPFTPFSFRGLDATLSQFDVPRVGVPGEIPQLQNFATSYDNFTFASSGFISSLKWVGLYDESQEATPDFPASSPIPLNPKFTVAFYDNNVNQPGTLIESFPVGFASETAITASNDPLNDRYFSYSATAAQFPVTAGVPYWVSIVAELDYNARGWQLARSGIGTLASVQDLQEEGNPGLTRFFDTSNYAIEITAVPEPGTFVTLVVVGGLFFCRRRLVSIRS